MNVKLIIFGFFVAMLVVYIVWKIVVAYLREKREGNF